MLRRLADATTNVATTVGHLARAHAASSPSNPQLVLLTCSLETERAPQIFYNMPESRRKLNAPKRDNALNLGAFSAHNARYNEIDRQVLHGRGVQPSAVARKVR